MKSKLTHHQLTGLQRRAHALGVRAYESASDDDMIMARTWYVQAREDAMSVGMVAGFKGDEALTRGAVALAVLSPQTRWAQNVRAAYALAAGNIDYAYTQVIHRFVDKAARAFDPDLTLAQVRALASGPKVSEFARACMGDVDACVWDVWMLRGVRLDAKALARAGVKDALTKGLQKAARETGVTVATLQALVWGHVRGSFV